MKFWKWPYLERVLFPFLVLLVLGISYGLQINKIGFYLDDWILLEAYKMGGVDRLMQLTFLDNRPLVFPLWLVGFWVANSTPLLWHIWSLVWRFAAVIAIWLGWRKLLPEKPIAVGLAALLFAVYPLFDQQGAGLTFSFHWITLTLWGLSFYFMLRAIETPKKWLLFSAIGMILFTFQIYSQEFFVGLEILRPFAIWWMLKGQTGRIRKTIYTTIPWLLIFVSYLYWRLAYLPQLFMTSRNTPTNIGGLLSNPLKTLTSLSTMTIRSLLEGIGGVWYQTIDPISFSIGKNADFISWIIAMALFIIALLAVWRLKSIPDEQHSISWMPPFIFGFIFFLGGIAPGLSIGQHFTLTNWTSDRFAMASMPGAALMISSLVYGLIGSNKAKIGIMCLLISLSVGFQFRTATIYRHSWQKQERLYWQLAWRIPAVEKDTAFLGDGALAYGMGKWANAAAINVLYGSYPNPRNVDYWYIEAPTLSVETLGQITEYKKLQMSFLWDKDKSIVFQYDTDLSPCLWVVDQDDFTNPDLDKSIRAALPLSDLSRITTGEPRSLAKTFGNEPDHEWWCYYFQAGELAAQENDWEKVIEIWQEASAKGHKPYQSSEYITFLQAAGYTEKWALAEEITQQASILTESKSQLCDMWQGIQENHVIPVGLQNTLIHSYGCTNLE